MKRIASITAAALAVLSIAAVGGANKAAAAPAQLSPQQQAFVDTPTPKTILIDATTGNVLSITPNPTPITPSSITPDLSIHPASRTTTDCHSDDACWAPSQTPDRNYRFRGTGSTTGRWTNRGPMYTKNHWTSVCWAESAQCSPRSGPNTIIAFTSTVTGTKVRNFT